MPYIKILTTYSVIIDLIVKRATAVHGFYGIFILVILNIA
jgi:hypothetical protein